MHNKHWNLGSIFAGEEDLLLLKLSRVKVLHIDRPEHLQQIAILKLQFFEISNLVLLMHLIVLEHAWPCHVNIKLTR